MDRYSLLSDEDLQAIAKNDWSRVSTRGLQIIAGEREPEPTAPARTPASTERTWGEVPRDVGAQALSGLGALIKFPGQLYGLATGDFRPIGNLGLGQRVQERAEQMKSPGLRAREEQLTERIQEAEQRGQTAAFMEALKGTFTDPALLGGAVVESIPAMLPALGLGAAVARTATQRALAKGAEAAAARAAGAAAGVGTAKGVGAVQQGAEVGAEAYKDLNNEFLRQGLSEPEAAKRTLNAARAAGASGAIISYLAQSLPGASALEEAIITGQRRVMGRVGAGIAGGLKEAPSEAIEEGGGRATQNVALREAIPDQPISAGVGEAAGRAAAAGLGLGAGVGAIQRGPARPAPQVTPPPPPPPAQPTGGPTLDPNAPAGTQGALFTEAEAPSAPTPEGLAQNKAYYDRLQGQLDQLTRAQTQLRAQADATTDPATQEQLRQQSIAVTTQISNVAGEMARYAPTIPSVAQEPRIDAEARGEEAARVQTLEEQRQQFDTLQRENERLKAEYERAAVLEDRVKRVQETTRIRAEAARIAPELERLQTAIQQGRRAVPTEAAQRTPAAEGQLDLRFDDTIRLEDLPGIGVPIDGGTNAQRAVRGWFLDNVIGRKPEEVQALVQRDPSSLQGSGLRARALAQLLSTEPAPPAFQEKPRAPAPVPTPSQPAAPVQGEFDFGGAEPSVEVPERPAQPPVSAAPPTQPAAPAPGGLGGSGVPAAPGAGAQAAPAGTLGGKQLGLDFEGAAPAAPAAPRVRKPRAPRAAPPAAAPTPPAPPAEPPEAAAAPAAPPKPARPAPREDRDMDDLSDEIDAAQRWTRVRSPEMPAFKDLSEQSRTRAVRANRAGSLDEGTALRIAQDDELSRESPLRSAETIKAKVGVNAPRVAKMLGQQLYDVTEEMPKVTVKELFQNAFDATKEGLERGQIDQGKIYLLFHENDRTIEIVDNGPGMPVSVMAKEFLEIAGTQKGTTRSSGGFGIAKVQFLYGNKELEVVSLRDGVLARMVTTGDTVQAALEGRGEPPTIETTTDPAAIEEAVKRYFPDGHGTSVKITVPDSYVNTDTRQTTKLPFRPYSLTDISAINKSPLFENVQVRTAVLYGNNRNSVLQNEYLQEKVPTGADFPQDAYAPLADVKFPWGSARVYVSTAEDADSTPYDNFHVLSNGLWQFSSQLGSEPYTPFPRQFYINLDSNKKPDEPGYPFDLNRQRFTPAAEKDVAAIQKYLRVLYGQETLSKDVLNFGTTQYVNADGTVSDPTKLEPKVPTSTLPTFPTIKPSDKVTIKDGRMYVNGTAAPELSEEDLKAARIDVDALTVPQDQIDPNKVLLHVNLEDKATGESLYQTAINNFGAERVNKYLYGVGDMFIRLRDALIAVDSSYAPMAEEGIGVSLDKEYVGVNIRVPFKGMFLNPGYTKLSGSSAEIAVAMMGTMQHEMAHFKNRNHGASFASEMQRINVLLDTHPSFDIFAAKKYFVKHIRENQEIFDFFKKAINDGNFQPIGKRFKDSSFEQIGDEGVGRAMEDAGRRGEGRSGVPRGTGSGTASARAVGVSAGVPSQTAPRGTAGGVAPPGIPPAAGAPTYAGAFPAGGPSLQMAQSATSFLTKFRTRVADKAATTLESLSADFNGAVRNALNAPSLEPLYRQAEASDQLIPAYLRMGSIIKEKSTGLWRAATKPGLVPPAEVLNIVGAWGNSRGLSFQEAWAESGKIMESARQKEFKDLNASMAKGRQFPVSMSDADIKKYYGIYASDPTFHLTLRKVLDEARFDMIDNMVRVGRIPQEMADDWKAATAYIPFDRVEDLEQAFRSGRRFGRGIAQLGKANPELVDVATVDRQVKNALDNYFNWLGWGVRQVVQTDATINTLRALERVGQAKFLPGGAAQLNSNNKDRRVMAYSKGNEIFFEVPSAYHAAAFNMQITPLPAIFGVMNKLSTFLRTAITAIPTFTATQIPQDIQRAILYSGVKDPAMLTARTLSNFTEFSQAALLGKLPQVEHELGEYGIAGDFDFRMDGAADSFLKGMGVKPRKGGVAGEFVQRLSDIARASDFALRRAIYEQTLYEGGDQLLALHRAREIINFRRYGMGDQFGVLHILTQTVPFYNAYIQGMDVLYRSLTGKDAPSGVDRKQALKQFYTTALYASSVAVLYALGKAGDEEYENMDLRERDKTWVLGGGFGIPVPGELGILFKALPERVLEAMRKQGTPDEAVAAEAVISWFRAAFDEYANRGAIPAPLKPILENLTNYSFLSGRVLEGTYQAGLLPSERTTSRTSELSKTIARFTADTTGIEVSPIKIDNFLQGYLGTTAGLTFAVTDSLINPGKMDRPLHQIVGLTAFTYDPVGTRRASEFYDLREKVVQSQNTLNELMKTDLTRAADFAEKNADKLMLYKAVNSTLKEISRTRAYRNWLNSADAADVLSQKERADQMEEIKRYEQQLFEWTRDIRNHLKL